jgi:molecular chaperone HscC
LKIAAKDFELVLIKKSYHIGGVRLEIIGIDLGTTYSLVSVWSKGKAALIPNPFGDLLTPSVVSLDSNGEILVGRAARERLISHPEMTAAGFKQFMGTEKKFLLGDKSFFAEDLSSFIIKRLKQDAEAYLGFEIKEAVISVPAYFNDSQRSAAKSAGALAGLRVDRIINEPSAASIAYRQLVGREGTFLVFDFGGGTLDVSVVDMFENVVDIVAVAGDNHLGGDDINRAIADTFYIQYPELEANFSQREKAQLIKIAEQCKIMLSSANIAILNMRRDGRDFKMQLTNNALIKICASVLLKIKTLLKKALKDSQRSINEIDEVIMAGGSSNMLIIQEYIKHLTQKTPRLEIEPEKAIAIGAGIVAGIKKRDGELHDLVLTDICPFTMGTKVRSEVENATFSPIIERNSPLPISEIKYYCTAADNQDSINIEIYQGESPDADKNLLLGEMVIEVPPLPAGDIILGVRFSYDINGILEVNVQSKKHEINASKLIIHNKNLSRDEIEKRVQELELIKITPREKEENRYLIARAERIYAEAFGASRELISEKIKQFELQIDAYKNIKDIIKARRAFEDFLDVFDRFEDGIKEDAPGEYKFLHKQEGV